MTIQEIVEAVSDLTDQTDLNRVAEAINRARSIRKQKLCAQFVKGEEVSFVHRARVHTGTVERVNSKSITVHEANGNRWRIAPSLLTKVSESLAANR